MAGEIFLILIFLVSFLFLFFYFQKRIEKIEKKDLFLYLKEDIEALKRKIDGKDSFFVELAKELSSIKEVARSIKDIKEAMSAPKVKGNLGEIALKEQIETVLPKDFFKIQAEISPGRIVDAVIKTKEGMIPVDSKFPLNSFLKYKNASQEEKEKRKKEFQKVLKKYIEEISQKYILPHQGTVNFAVLYIPNERIFYEILFENEEIFNFASEKKVFFVSPRTFYYFLKIIFLSLQGARIEKEAKKILEILEILKKENQSLIDEISLLSSHLEKARKSQERLLQKYLSFKEKLEMKDFLEKKE